MRTNTGTGASGGRHGSSSPEGALSRRALKLSWAIMGHHGLLLTADYNIRLLGVLSYISLPRHPAGSQASPARPPRLVKSLPRGRAGHYTKYNNSTTTTTTTTTTNHKIIISIIVIVITTLSTTTTLRQ